MMIARLAHVCLILGFLSVNGRAQVDHFFVEALGGGDIGDQNAGVPIFIQLTAMDSVNNIVTGFGETVDITSAGTLAAGGGTTGSFVDGALDQCSLTFSNTGIFSITATRTGGTQTGTGKLFTATSGAAA